MNNKSYPFNQIKHLCSGCGACAQACVHHALKMKADGEGFLYPVLDEGKCVQCGMCDLTCPMISDTHQENETKGNSVYLATAKDMSFGLHCATVGICTRLSLNFLQNGGNVCGVILEETDWTARHICTNDEDTVKRMRNSKYLQSDTVRTFSEVKSLLKKQKPVLYIGTPCQIAGLKAYLRKQYEQLLTIDLVCHGVFSPKLVTREIEYWETLFNGKLSNLCFRSKRLFPWSMGGVVNFDLINSKGKEAHIERHAISSPTYRCFAYSGDGYSYNLRPSCYSCPFRSRNRYGDLTVGDAWGLKDKYPRLFTSHNMQNGVSILFCNTQRGINACEILESYYNLHKIPFESAFTQPALLPASRKIPTKRTNVYENSQISYGQLVQEILQVDLERENKSALRQLAKIKFKTLIKRIFFLI